MQWAYSPGNQSEYREINSIAKRILEIPLADARKVAPDGYQSRKQEWYE